MWRWVFDVSFNTWGVELCIWFDTPTSGWVLARLGPVSATLRRLPRR